MKKIIAIEVLLVFILAVLIASATEFFIVYSDTVNFVYHHIEGTGIFIRYSNIEGVSALLVCGIFAVVAAISATIAIVIIAIKNFPVFKPFAEKIKAKRAARKAKRVEKKEANKQARIEQLQAELDELKKDE